MEELIAEISSSLKNWHRYEFIISLCLLLAVSVISYKMSDVVTKGAMNNKKTSEKNALGEYTVYIDPGHGGCDPGKIGKNNILEKDINLCISKRLKSSLQNKKINVKMTRENDSGLYSDDDTNKKISDLRKRCEMVNKEYMNNNKTICISIHQNSYPKEEVYGPQVFYYSNSEDGRKLAYIMQNKINDIIDIDRPRVQKDNNDYYLLVKTMCPTIIIECGFLSNPREAALLTDKSYQELMVKAITEGIEEYIK